MDGELQTALKEMAHNLACVYFRIPAATDERINQRIREAVERDQKVKREAATYGDDAHRILRHLNTMADCKYQAVAANLKLIAARQSEVDDEDGIKHMINRQVKLWKCTDMQKYLRPETLFNATKFQSYYAQRNDPIPGQQQDREAAAKQLANLREELRYASPGPQREALLAEIQRLEGGVR